MALWNLSEAEIKQKLKIVTDEQARVNNIKKIQFSPLEPPSAEEGQKDISFLKEIELLLEVELGSTTLTLREVLNINEGDVITLSKMVGDTVDLAANDVWLARGEVLVINDVLGIRISSLNKE
jgi:flagellar motor switch protein FliN/FliY